MKTLQPFLFLVFALSILLVTGCGDKGKISPDPIPASTTVNGASNVEITTATISYSVYPGDSKVTETGVCYSSNTTNPSINDTKVAGSGSSEGNISVNLTGLSEGTLYYVRSYVTTDKEVIYSSSNASFATRQSVPASASIDTVLLGINSASITYSVTENDSQITETGVCYGETDVPTINDNKVVGSGDGNIQVDLSNLQKNTVYHARSYVKTNNDVIYSDTVKVWTYELKDQNGRGYHAVVINGLTWLVENWADNHYQNGDLISMVKENKYWSENSGEGLITGAMCYYENDSTKYAQTYGALYNGYVMQDSRGFGPRGWRVPTGVEVNSMSVYYGGNLYSGGKLKEVGTEHWLSPNTGATNSSGFTGLPGGGRGDSRDGTILGVFADLGMGGIWWLKDEHGPNERLLFYIGYDDTHLTQVYTYKKFGYCIRFIKD